MSLVAASLLGLGLGVKHALEADHLAAVCTFVAQDNGVLKAAKTGALWGLGHSAVILLAGGALVATGARVPEPLAVALDLAVALMLVGLGAAALWSRRGAEAAAEARARQPLAVGLVHGASGTAALTLLVASTMPGRSEALAFVALFGIASLIGMAAVATLVAVPLRSVARRSPARVRILQGIAGAASIAAGVVVAWSTVGGGA